MNLTNKRRAFIEEYLTCWNATEAARRVGFKCPNNQGPRLLLNASVQAEIKKRLDEKAMGANEVLTRLADMARADMGDFLDIESMSFSVNLYKANELGLTKLIKKVREKTVMTSNKDGEETETHTVELELYDAQAALALLGRYHKLFTDNLDLTSGGEPLCIVVRGPNEGSDV